MVANDYGFTFAGFQFPRKIPRLLRRAYLNSGVGAIGCKQYKLDTAYSAAPKPGSKGITFYLGSDFCPTLRWDWCDNLAASIRHTGWWTDDDGINDKIRGVVFRLPRSRGFLAGWSMGQGMICCVDYDIIDDAVEAAHRADDMARYAAECEREYQADLATDDDE